MFVGQIGEKYIANASRNNEILTSREIFIVRHVSLVEICHRRNAAVFFSPRITRDSVQGFRMQNRRLGIFVLPRW